MAVLAKGKFMCGDQAKVEGLEAEAEAWGVRSNASASAHGQNKLGTVVENPDVRVWLSQRQIPIVRPVRDILRVRSRIEFYSPLLFNFLPALPSTALSYSGLSGPPLRQAPGNSILFGDPRRRVHPPAPPPTPTSLPISPRPPACLSPCGARGTRNRAPPETPSARRVADGGQGRAGAR